MMILLKPKNIAATHNSKTQKNCFQDANECWTELIRCMQKKLPAVGEGEVTSFYLNENEFTSVKFTFMYDENKLSDSLAHCQ